ncbi:hypothetical protein Nepgr_013174 [Nepenthes gracilis]|uniref:Uncharacterized protein n=1 Tax=Nepenthes gracilis TaxID=150966 RepID=A0AAD3SHB2_NEPGR|nr:hypothetical protein Nepgr_013174 [Nepenthes gracilis]
MDSNTVTTDQNTLSKIEKLRIIAGNRRRLSGSQDCGNKCEYTLKSGRRESSGVRYDNRCSNHRVAVDDHHDNDISLFLICFLTPTASPSVAAMFEEDTLPCLSFLGFVGFILYLFG